MTSFNNLGSEDLGPLGKGMAAMLITDLSQVPDLRVVEAKGEGPSREGIVAPIKRTGANIRKVVSRKE